MCLVSRLIRQIGVRSLFFPPMKKNLFATNGLVNNDSPAFYPSTHIHTSESWSKTQRWSKLLERQQFCVGLTAA